MKLPSGSLMRRRYSSRTASRVSGSSDAQNSPAGPTPNWNESQSSSKLWWREETSRGAASTSSRPARLPRLAELFERRNLQGLGRRRRDDGARGLPEDPQEQHLGEVPRTSGDHSSGTDDAAHLDETRDGVVEKVQDQLRQRNVEGVLRPGQRLGGALPHVGTWHPGRARLDERRGVDRGDVLRSEPAGELLGQDPEPQPTSSTLPERAPP